MSAQIINSRGYALVLFLVFGSIVAVLLLALLWYLGAFKPFTSKFFPQKNASESSVVIEGKKAEVKITGTGFSPPSITVKKNTTVTFVNKDSAAHRVSSDPHPTHIGLPGFDSAEILQTDEMYSYSFADTGNFKYHDHQNPTKFRGNVIVVE